MIPKDIQLELEIIIQNVNELERDFGGFVRKRTFRKFGKVRRRDDKAIPKTIRTTVFDAGRKKMWMP